MSDEKKATRSGRDHARGNIALAGAWLVAAAIAAMQPITAHAVTVFAAASLHEALEAVTRQYVRAGGPKVVVSYAGTAALARQIEHGAPADLFISADLAWMDFVAAKGLVDAATRVNLLGNRMVLISPATRAIDVKLTPGVRLAALLGDGRLAMADPDSIPAGKYAKAALESLGAWASISPRVVRAESVRAALVLVSRGEAPLGIVYATDARADNRVRVAGSFAASLHPPIVYPAAVLAASREAANAGKLLQYLKSDAARALWEKFGFATPDGAQ